MPAITYREHVDLFNKYRVASVPYSKIFLSLAFALVLSLSVSLHMTSVNNRQVVPVNEQAQYFQSASNSFYKSKQSVDDLRASLQVAGVKTQRLDNLKEASASGRVPGFFVTLGDIQKTVDNIRLSRNNIENERKNLENSSPPELYKTLDAQINEYIIQADNFLSAMEKDQIALKEIISAATPAFFLPTLSDEEVWESGDIEKIKAYYAKRQAEAQEAYDSFKKTETLPQLQPYKDLQLSHILLVVNVAQNINSTLGRPTPETEEGKLQLQEEAYQVLVGAKRENDELADQLSQQRIQLSSLTSYTQELASLANRERVIESGLAQGNEALQLVPVGAEPGKDSFLNINFAGFTR